LWRTRRLEGFASLEGDLMEFGKCSILNSIAPLVFLNLPINRGCDAFTEEMVLRDVVL